MKKLTIAFLGLFVLAACATINYCCPKYHGVDKKIQPFYNEYIRLSAIQKITFDKKVNMGFGKLEGETVGMCVYTATFREITIDPDWWKFATETSKMTLVFHELTHCYCGRNHDYGGLAPYPEAKDLNSNFAATVTQVGDWKVEPLQEIPRSQLFEQDACPTSIMYPKVLFDYCMQAHYNHYINEMFERCSPY